MSSPAGSFSSRVPCILVLVAGVVAALHAGKIPPAVPALRTALGLSLVEAGFLISLMQIAGATVGLAIGLATGSVGLRRSLIAGLLLLALAGFAGGFADGALALLALRALEGAGFLLVAMPAPALLRQLVAPDRLSAVLGLWGAYMPVGTALALLTGPAVLASTGWRGWWWWLAALALVTAFFAWRLIPADTSLPSRTSGRPWQQRLRDTLQHRGPWLVALSFACYSSQWLAVVGFLPEIYAAARVSATWIAPLTALAAAVNMIGNIAAGRCLARGMAAHHLLWMGFGAMGLGAVLAFVPATPLGPEARYLAILVFSAVGGLVPGTLFTLAVRLAPSTDTIATTVGWTQQLSALGQLIGPPLVAWIAAQAGGWQWTGVLAALASAAGVVIAIRLAQVRPIR
ncbi:MFS transporter [Achromobacter sp. GG226]|nr:MFS transporter [Verticiella sp. GG226]MBU4612384.1 MFS transporter [Verticiella sp. GG226]